MLNTIKNQTLIVPLAALITAGALLSGCSQPDISRHHAFRPGDRFGDVWDGSVVDVTRPVAFDIRNHHGSVWVEVDDQLEAPEVDVRVSWDAKDWHDEWPHHDSGGVIDAQYADAGEAGGVVTINSNLIASSPESAFLDLRVRTPRCDGIRVENDGGPIVMIGVGGAITAHNGGTIGRGGRIELRTSRPVRDPVALVTTQGRVSAVLDPEGRGTIEIDTERGEAEFGTIYGTMSNVRPGVGRYHGVWNGGVNPIVARSGDGDCHIQIKPDAEMYSVADDWLALFKD